MTTLVRTSLSRIAGLDAFEIEPLSRQYWADGDYVIGEVTGLPGPGVGIELTDGRMMQVDIGDRLLGAFGVRFATLEATGTWEAIGPDGRMTAMTAAGLFGKLISKSPLIPTLTELCYTFTLPVLLIIGSSMSAGKTRSAQIIIRRLRALGLRVLAAKLTGAGRYRDLLAMRDAGADPIFDFVDAGLPSTVCPAAEYRQAASSLLSNMAVGDADVAVIEAGASPLEPYNGDVAVELLEPNIRLTVLCTADPYAVVGMMQAFGRRPDLVAGVACNTDAGQALIHKLTGVPSLRLPDPAALPALDGLLRERFGRAGG
ncbi:MAG: hypothetical protein MUC53_03080 [Candidatus Contendobacter sp.]|nr:hypothetical protein [Candidatus Contendobacter sp.]